MKNRVLQLIIMLVLLAGGAKTQNLIAVQNGGVPEFYTNLDSAVVHAIDGDTVLIPGGPFTFSLNIDKQLTIIGVGVVLDSSIATSHSLIYGGINFVNGSNSSAIIGLYFTGSINSGSDVNSICIKRCVFTDLTVNSSCSNWIFVENMIYGKLRSSHYPGASSFMFLNNIIHAHMGGSFYDDFPGFTNCVFKNNIFFSGASCSYGCMYPIKSPNSVIENNVFLGGTSWASLLSADFSYINNNLFVIYWTAPSSCTAMNNIINQPSEDIFEDLDEADFHLNPQSPGKNGGRDGTDIGIYGGSFPWKDGMIPFNPHIQLNNIPNITDQNGNLNVNIKVAAQDH